MRFVVSLVVLTCIIVGAWFVFGGSASLASWNGFGFGGGIIEEPAPPLGPEYQNDQFRFSLQTPDGYTVQEFQEDGVESKTIVLQDAQGNGIQIMVTPFGSDLRELTADMVRADIPDMEVSDVQPVEVGESHKGVAFKSDNEAFGGASREVWFVFGGNLYQISTYARLDPLLQAMFGTWKFF